MHLPKELPARPEHDRVAAGGFYAVYPHDDQQFDKSETFVVLHCLFSPFSPLARGIVIAHPPPHGFPNLWVNERRLR